MSTTQPHKDELQIEAYGAVPTVNGKIPDFIRWYKVEPEKLTLCRYDTGAQKEITEEFDIRTVKLSGVPADYFSSKSRPSCDSPEHENDRI